MWRAVVAPNHQLFIGLLVVFEAVAGTLLLLGGRKTQVGLVAVIGFHIALLAFGWMFSLWVAPMLLALVLLLRAERSAFASPPKARPLIHPHRLGMTATACLT